MNPRRCAALASVPLAFAGGSLAVRAWLARAPHTVAGDLAQPLPVVTAWHAYGAVAFAILAATVAAATAGVVLAVGYRPPAEPRDALAVAPIAALALAAAGSWPVVFSSDVYAYAAYGALALSGHNPYAPVPGGLHGALVDAARIQWSGPFPPCVYGPLFVALAREGVAALQPAGVAVTLAGFRLAAGLAFLAGIVLLNAALAGLPPRTRFTAVCAYGLNPVALWTVAEGHNDAFMMLAVIAGTVLAVRGGRLTGALLLALSPLLKAAGILAAALAALDAIAFRRPGFRTILLGLAAGTAMSVALAIPPLLPTLASLGARGRYAPEVSAQGLMGLGPALGLACLAALHGLNVLRRRRRAGFAWVGIAVLLALPNPYPWYAPWLVPPALLAGTEAAGIALWAATISSLARYLPDAVGNIQPATARVAALVATLPLVWALAGAGRTASARKKVIPQP